MPNLAAPTQKLLGFYDGLKASSQKSKENTPTIHVDEVASRVAVFYEKIRGIIDWKEEHLLKRRAIERILKRRIFSKIALGDEAALNDCSFAEPLILELIRGGHFPNDKIEEKKIEIVQGTINKYICIIQKSEVKENESKIHLYTWLSEIAACEIEEILSPSRKERALIDFMFDSIKDRIKIGEGVSKSKDISEAEKKIQIYIAVQIALFNLDSPVIAYHLLKYYYPDWKNMQGENLSGIIRDIYNIQARIESDLDHPLSDKFYQICEKHDTPYLLLGDVLLQNPGEEKKVLTDPDLLEREINKAYSKRVETLRKRLNRAAFYSTLSIFLTNIVSLFVIEIPFNRIVTGYYFNFSAMLIDIFVPTFLMLFMVITVKPPGKENKPRAVMEIMKTVYEGKSSDKEIYEIKAFRKRSMVFTTIINLIYLVAFLAILWVIVWSLARVNFPPLSHVIFIIFLSLIAFAGAKLRQRAKELQIVEEKESFLYFFIDPFAIPIIQLGKWLTLKWKRYNIIAVFFSALIDMPFTTFVEFIEQWRFFLKEKKEKIH